MYKVESFFSWKKNRKTIVYLNSFLCFQAFYHTVSYRSAIIASFKLYLVIAMKKALTSCVGLLWWDDVNINIEVFLSRKKVYKVCGVQWSYKSMDTFTLLHPSSPVFQLSQTTRLFCGEHRTQSNVFNFQYQNDWRLPDGIVWSNKQTNNKKIPMKLWFLWAYFSIEYHSSKGCSRSTDSTVLGCCRQATEKNIY